MKIKSLFIAALVVMSSSVVFAGKEDPTRSAGLAVVPVKGSQVFKVIYKGETSGKVKLNVYSANGSLVFKETIYSNGFICPLNFSGLASGDYTIELVDARGKQTEKISYLEKNSLKNVHISRISKEEGKYLLAIGNTTKEVFSVSIYDNSNTLVHTESKLIDGNFAQVYKFSNVAASYTFQVTDAAGNTKTIKF